MSFSTLFNYALNQVLLANSCVQNFLIDPIACALLFIIIIITIIRFYVMWCTINTLINIISLKILLTRISRNLKFY